MVKSSLQPHGGSIFIKAKKFPYLTSSSGAPLREEHYEHSLERIIVYYYMEKKKQSTAKSNKERFIEQMEELLLMHLILPGEQLPPERELAQEMGVSRPVIHEGLLELGARGLISIRPRHGWIVNNFAEEGALPLLSSLYRFSSPQSAARIDADLEEVRQMMLGKSLVQYFSLDVAKNRLIHRSLKN